LQLLKLQGVFVLILDYFRILSYTCYEHMFITKRYYETEEDEVD